MSIAPAHAYDLLDFDRMLADEVRTPAYLTAIRAAVRPGDVVVEIGTGTGYFAVACAQAGARHVYAIEMNPAIALGPEIAKANGVADRITFVHGYSTHVSIPERGDVLLEDLRGVLPVLWGRIPSIVDARERLLTPDARLITQRDTLWAVPCRAPARVAPILESLGAAPHGIARGPIAQRLRDDLYRVRLEPAECLAEPVQWGTVEYATVTSAELSGTMEWTIARDGSLDGVCLWFRAELFGGAVIDNGPAHPETVYAQAFFPLTRAIAAHAGDRVTLDFRAKRFGESYIFAWDTTHVATDGTTTAYRQSSLGASLPTSIDVLRRRRAEHVPTRGATSALVTDVIGLVDGARTLREIADLVAVRHPQRFDAAEALTYVTTLLGGFADADAGLGGGSPP